MAIGYTVNALRSMAQISNDALEAALPSKEEDASATLVDWDGPNDAANPVNWPSRKRWTHILTVAILGLIPYAHGMQSDISYSTNLGYCLAE